MSKVETVRELVLCDCCVMAAVNADTSGHDYYCAGEPEPLSALGAGEYARLVVSVDEDDRQDFSSAPCGGCGMALAGARSDAVILAGGEL